MFDYRAWGCPLAMGSIGNPPLSPARQRLVNRRATWFLGSNAIDVASLDPAPPYAFLYTLLQGVPFAKTMNQFKLNAANFHEMAFLHTNNPASLVVQALEGSKIALHWLPDRRGSRFGQNAGYEYRHPVTKYKVLRATGTGQYSDIAILERADTDTTLTEISYLDDNAIASGLQYRYKIESAQVDGVGETPVWLAYSEPDTILYDTQAIDQPSFWIHDLSVTLPPIYGGLASVSVTVFSYQPQTLANIAADSLYVSIRRPFEDKRHPDARSQAMNGPQLQNNGHYAYTATMSDEVSPGIRGGHVFRFIRRPAGTEPPTPLFRDRYFTAAPNNRLMFADGVSYLGDPSSIDYQSACITDIDSTLLTQPASSIARRYDGVLGDAAQINFANAVVNVLPRGWSETDSVNYAMGFHALTAAVRENLHARNKKLWINGMDDRLFDCIDGAGLEGFGFLRWYGTVVTGDAWATQMQQLRAALLSPTVERVVASTEYPQNFGQEASQDSTDRAPSRLYILASYLLLAQDKLLLGSEGIDTATRGYSLYPEWQINMGQPTGALDVELPPLHLLGSAYPDSSPGLACYPDQAAMNPRYRNFEHGTVIVNFDKYKEGQAVLWPESGPEIPVTPPVYRVCVEGSVEGLLNGGRFWTVPVSGRLIVPPGTALILMKDPVRSPEVDQTAVFPLFTSTAAGSRLAVHATHWNGSRLWVEADGSSLGLDSHIVLPYDEGGDDIYMSSDLNVSAQAPGLYSLPVYARGDDGIAVYGSVSVLVVEGTPPSKYVAMPHRDDHYGLSYTGLPYSSVGFDYNADGKQDLLVTVRDADSYLFERMNSSSEATPQFRDRTLFAIPGIADQPQGFRGSAYADFNNDGYYDLFMAHRTTPKLLINDANASQSNQFLDCGQMVSLSTLAADSWGGAWGDYDGDGFVDLAICRAHTPEDHGSNPRADIDGALPVVLLHNDMQSLGTFHNVADILGSAEDRVTRSVTISWGDVNGDGRLDLFVGQAEVPPVPAAPNPRQIAINWTPGAENPSSRLFVQQPDGTFANEWLARTGSYNGAAIQAGRWVDLDNDGDEDLVVAGSLGASFLRNDAGDLNWGFLPYWSAARGIATPDFDLDGRRDILALPDSLGAAPLSLYWNRGASSAAPFADASLAMGIRQCGSGGIDGAAVVDFGGDGDPDLYLGKPLGGDQYLLQNVKMPGGDDAPINHWAGIDLRGGGAGDNRSAIGATVTVQVGGLSQTQRVDGGSGRGGQEGHTLIFGLGLYAEPTVSADICWPNGTHQIELLNVGQVTVVNDLNIDPQLISSSIAATSEPYPGSGVTWIFRWNTAHLTFAMQDSVQIKSTYDAPGQPPSPCQIGQQYTWLHQGVPGVTTTVQVVNGVYQHELRWDRPCAATCTYWYQVRSSSLLQNAVGPAVGQFKRLILSVCIADDPDPNAP